MQDVYKNIEKKNNRSIKGNASIVFNDMIADIISNKKLNQVISELLIRGRKVNIASVFITRSYFPVSKDVRLNCTLFTL